MKSVLSEAKISQGYNGISLLRCVQTKISVRLHRRLYSKNTYESNFVCFELFDWIRAGICDLRVSVRCDMNCELRVPSCKFLAEKLSEEKVLLGVRCSRSISFAFFLGKTEGSEGNGNVSRPTEHKSTI